MKKKRGKHHPKQTLEKRPAHRPRITIEDLTPQKVFEFSAACFTQEQMAVAFGVSRRTFQSRLSDDPELREAFDQANEERVQRVERSTFESAIGYMAEERKLNRKGQIIERKQKFVKDTTAALALLNNWAPSRYKSHRDQGDAAHTTINILIPFAENGVQRFFPANARIVQQLPPGNGNNGNGNGTNGNGDAADRARSKPQA